MAIIRWSLCILALCASFTAIEGQIDGSRNRYSMKNNEMFNSQRGLGCCRDGSCPCMTSDVTKPESIGHGTTEPVYTVSEIEPQNADLESPTDGESFCPRICDYLLKSMKDIEWKHPGIADVKCGVLANLLKIASFFLVDGDCHPTVKFLDLIILAADELKNIYASEGESCEYLQTVEPTEVPAHISTNYKTSVHTRGYDKTEIDSYHGKTTLEPVAEYFTSEATNLYSYKTKEPEITSSYERTRVPTEEIIAEDDDNQIYPPFVGSVRGIPGLHYPNYTEVPVTSFSCAEKQYIPGFYADLETECQVFHVCYEHRRESFLCPLGTTFNQPILACDYWYSSNCSLAPIYYEVNAKTKEISDTEEMDSAVGELITSIMENEKIPKDDDDKLSEDTLDDLVKFLPVKAKITVFSKSPVLDKDFPKQSIVKDISEVSSEIFDDIMSTATRVVSKAKDVIDKVPEVGVEIGQSPSFKYKNVKSSYVPAIKLKTITKPEIADKVVKAKIVESVSSKIAKTVYPAIAKAKLATTKFAVPVKMTAKKVAIPFTKTKGVSKAVPVGAKAKVAIPIVKISQKAIPLAKMETSKVTIPSSKFSMKSAKVLGTKAVPLGIKSKAAVKTSNAALKAKILAASLPFTKVTALKSIPLSKSKYVASGLKPKLFKSNFPIVKGKLLAPVKINLGKSAISPLTKKALALGYIKLLKAKKIAMMG